MAGPEIPPNACQGGITLMAVDSNGIVYPCHQALGLPEFAMGDLNESSLIDIWRGDKWAFFRGGWELDELTGCFGCKAYIGCACRPCRVQAHKKLGNRFAPMPICIQNADELGLVRENIAALLGGDSVA